MTSTGPFRLSIPVHYLALLIHLSFCWGTSILLYLQVVVVPLARRKIDATRTFKTANKNKSMKCQTGDSQDQQCDNKVEENAEFEEAMRDYLQMRVLDTVYEEDERSWASAEVVSDIEHVQSVSQSTPFKQLLEFTPNHLVQTSTFQKVEKTRVNKSPFEFIRECTATTCHPVSPFMSSLPFYPLAFSLRYIIRDLFEF